MRYRFLLIFVAILILTGALSGCDGDTPEEVRAAPGQQFTLSPGQRALLEGEELEIEFLEVSGDSRCPANVECIWAGEVSCLVEITYSGSTYRMMLTQPGLTDDHSNKTFQDYLISFRVDPYPEAGKEIARDDYRLRLTISKSFALSGGILVSFDVLGENYNIFITNEETIEDVFAVQRGESNALIPSGRLIKGSVQYNEPWSWHIDSEDIHMAEVTIELCDGKPSQVEAQLDYWVDVVQRFCPWSARILKIEDYRAEDG